MKTITLAKEHRENGRRICWRRDLAVPHESLWGKLRKIAMLNSIAGNELTNLYRDFNKVLERSYARSFAAGDLRVLRGMDASEIKRLTSDDAEPLRGVVDDYVKEAGVSRYQLDVWSTPYLRYCPECIVQGVHVAYFQLVCVQNCPVHHTPLLDSCPRCQGTIAYEPPRTLNDAPFGCRCGHVFWRLGDDPKPQRSTRLICSRHREEGDWLRNALCVAGSIHHPWNDFVSDAGRGLETGLGFSMLATFLSIAQPEHGRLSSNFFPKLRRYHTTTWYSVPKGTRRRGRCTENELVAIYKSICRNLFRRRLRRHRAAIHLMAKSLGGPLFRGPHGEITWTRPFAPVATAFLVWRMFWEGLTATEDIFRRRVARQYYNFGTTQLSWRRVMINRFKECFWSPSYTLPKGLGRGVEARWFAKCCYRVFTECIGRIDRQFESSKEGRGRKRQFTTEWIDGLYTPTMLPVVTGEHEVTLHWFDITSMRAPDFETMIHDPPTKVQLRDYERFEDASQRSLVNAVSRAYNSRTHGT